jgi:hypothetical protein
VFATLDACAQDGRAVNRSSKHQIRVLCGTRPATLKNEHRPWRINATEDLAVSYRTFLDTAGKRWEVWMVTPAAAERRKAERRASTAGSEAFSGAIERRRTPDRRQAPFRRSVAVASEYSEGWLCFESEGEKRRLAPVPAGWQEAGPDRLSTWLQAAKRVVKCGP